MTNLDRTMSGYFSREPVGIRYSDVWWRDLMLVTEDDWSGWICQRYPNGRWMSIGKATDLEIAAIRKIPEA